MKNLLSKETDLLESKELRNKLASRIDVLEKVKTLLLLPFSDEATTQQVAEYYNVNDSNIKMLYADHKDEFDEDGVCIKSCKDFLKSAKFTLETFKGKSILTDENNNKFEIPNRGLRIFPRRAILRIGMLLRNSEVAKRVRTALLDIEEKTSTELKVQDINEEQKLMLEIGMAVASGNPTAVAIASSNLIAFKNRHITKLEESNKALANGILEWEDRSRINFAVRKLVQNAHLQYGEVWNELYKQLKNKYHMDLKARGKQPWIQYVKEEEWNNTIKCFSALCKYYGQEPSDMFCDLQLQEVQ